MHLEHAVAGEMSWSEGPASTGVFGDAEATSCAKTDFSYGMALTAYIWLRRPVGQLQ